MDKNGKLFVLDFKDYTLIMEKKFAKQFQVLTHVDLTTVQPTHVPVQLLQSAVHIMTSRFAAFLEGLLQPVRVKFCKSTINKFCKDSKHCLQDMSERKKL